MAELVKKLIFINRDTGNKCYVIKREKTLVHVKYVPSGMKCWYTDEDFSRLFFLT